MSLDLATIAPRADGKYSPLLYAWLKSKRFSHARQVFQTAEENAPPSASWRGGEIIIGNLQAEYVGGRKLGDIICGQYGVKSTGYAYSVRLFNLREITDEFWSEYERIGRCAWDAGHGMHMIGDGSRYTMRGQTRTCNWCGAKHRLVIRERTVVERVETWRRVAP